MLAPSDCHSPLHALETSTGAATWFARGLALCAVLTPLWIVAYAFAITGDPALRAQIVLAGCERLIGLLGAALAAHALHRLGQRASGALVRPATAAAGSAGESEGTARSGALRTALAA